MADGIKVQMNTVVDLRSAEETRHVAHPMDEGSSIIKKPEILNGKRFAKAVIWAQPCCCFKCRLCLSCLTCRLSKKRVAAAIMSLIPQPECQVLMCV
jgi:hypothetical protein